MIIVAVAVVARLCVGIMFSMSTRIINTTIIIGRMCIIINSGVIGMTRMIRTVRRVCIVRSVGVLHCRCIVQLVRIAGVNILL